ncbi:hypothetical protein [Methylobacterium aquaticum]|uniref:hypothetical protein n=1 Tax=Methylobacterium aquaticum TaxID=270351 RepID=UPI001931A006|nr:hypothetical protein [Methylobacterium aquaticum]
MEEFFERLRGRRDIEQVIPLDAVASTPETDTDRMMAENDRFSLRSIDRRADAGLTIEPLGFVAGLASSYDRFEIEAGNAGDIGPLRVTDIHLGISYRGQEAGWSFSGATLGGGTIVLGDFVADLDRFEVALPEAIKSSTLHDLAVTSKTGTSAFRFGLQGTFPSTRSTAGLRPIHPLMRPWRTAMVVGEARSLAGLLGALDAHPLPDQEQDDQREGREGEHVDQAGIAHGRCLRDAPWDGRWLTGARADIRRRTYRSNSARP